MEIEPENIVAIAREFVDENRELLEDPAVTEISLEILIRQGGQIGRVLGDESSRIGYAAADKAREIEKDYRQGTISPVILNRKVKRHEELKSEFDVYNQTLSYFLDFMTPIQEMYYGMVDRTAKELEDDVDDLQSKLARGIEASERLERHFDESLGDPENDT